MDHLHLSLIRVEDEADTWVLAAHVTYSGFSGSSEGYLGSRDVITAAQAFAKFPLPNDGIAFLQVGRWETDGQLREAHVKLVPMVTNGSGHLALDVTVARPDDGKSSFPARLNIRVPISYQQMLELSQSLLGILSSMGGSVEIALGAES